MDSTTSKILMIDHPACERVDVSGGKGSMIHKMRRQFAELFPNAFIIPYDTELTEGLLPEIERCMQVLNAEKFAVRSSSLQEDMVEYSFAGQYVSILNVSGAENILTAAKQVRDSVHSSQVQSYIKTRGITVDLKMSVLVMPMVGDEENTVSGVIFTSDVESGLPDIYITAIDGLGDKEVAGLVTPEITVMKETDSGTFEVFRRKPRQGYDDRLFLLENPVLQEIAHSAKQVERYMRELLPEVSFVDIEYCIRHGRLKFVQARPDTTLKNKVNVQMVGTGYEKNIILRAGTSASAGIASGTLVYCRNVEEAEKLESGNILLCNNTTSIWEPYMRRVSAIISKFGSSNCHTAIVSRESKIPCIVGISASEHESANMLENYVGKIITVDATKCTVYEGIIPESGYVSAQAEPNYTGLDDEDFEQAFHSATAAQQTYTDADGSKWIGKPNEPTSAILNRIHHKSHDFISDRFGWPRVTGRVHNHIFEVSMQDIHNWRVRLRAFTPKENHEILNEWQHSIDSYLFCSEHFTDSDLTQWIEFFVQLNGYMNLAFPLYMCISGQFEQALRERKIPEPYFNRIHHCVNPNTPFSWAQQATLDYIDLLNSPARNENDERNYAMRYRITPRFSQNFEDTPPFELLKENLQRDREQGLKPIFHRPFEEMYYPNDSEFQLIFENRMRAIHLKESAHHIKFCGQWVMLERISDKQFLKNLII